ncbi:MAG TPA: SDR family oxidoreductase [Polyangiaceae bacterium]|nr:SDR family oxidoreductase [Polyangiaceae bacterium]
MTERALLVTGFPGFRARAVLACALERDEHARPFLLVHPRRSAEARLALAELAGGDRARVIEGDPGAIDFGLGRKDYFELAVNVAEVQHVYQVLDLAAPAAAAEAVNVGGAREVAEFGRVARGLTRIVHHSSVFVSGDRHGIVSEAELGAGQTFRSPVARSLALAEAMLGRQASLPLTIVRAGHVIGDSRTGVVDRLDGPYPLLVLLASAPRGTALPLPPRADAPLHVSPVDYLARAALALAGDPAALRKTVHLIDPRPLSVRRLLELAGDYFGVPIESGLRPRAFGRALLGNPGLGLLAQNLRSIIELISTPVSYDDRVALELLGPAGIACPPLESYLGVLLSYVAARVAEKRVNDAPHKEPWDVAG